MPEIRGPGGAGNMSSPAVVAAARACRPVPRPDVAQVIVGGGHVVWPPGVEPTVILSLWSPVWSALDGTLSGSDLVDDVVAVTGFSTADAEQEVARALTVFLQEGMADGLDPLREVLEEAHRSDDAAQERDGHHVHHGEIDGVEFISTTVEVPLVQLRSVAGGTASLAELVAPDSCLGERLHLHEDAVIRTVEVGGALYSVRSVDPSVTAWIEDSPQHRPGEKGPIVAFVTAGPGGAGRTRWEVYDAMGNLAASTVERELLPWTVASLVGSYAASAPADGVRRHRVRLRAVARDQRVVLAPSSIAERPRGLLRQLARRGLTLLPVAELELGADGRTAWIAGPTLEVPSSGTTPHGDLDVVGLWGMARGDIEPSEAEQIALMVQGLEGGDLEHRQGVLDALVAVRRSHPMACGDVRSRSSVVAADRLAALFTP